MQLPTNNLWCNCWRKDHVPKEITGVMRVFGSSLIRNAKALVFEWGRITKTTQKMTFIVFYIVIGLFTLGWPQKFTFSIFLSCLLFLSDRFATGAKVVESEAWSIMRVHNTSLDGFYSWSSHTFWRNSSYEYNCFPCLHIMEKFTRLNFPCLRKSSKLKK